MKTSIRFAYMNNWGVWSFLMYKLYYIIYSVAQKLVAFIFQTEHYSFDSRTQLFHKILIYCNCSQENNINFHCISSVGLRYNWL